MGAPNKNYMVSEGMSVGGQEPQALGTTQKKITASVAVTKGMLVEVTGDFTVGPASAGSTKVCGIAAMDAAVGGYVVIDMEGFVKLGASSAVITAGDRVVSAGSGLVKSLGTITADVTGITAVAAVIGIAIAGCLADGNPYIKLVL